MLPVQLANFFVSDLTWAFYDRYLSITTPRNLISETCFISVSPIIIGGILSLPLSFETLLEVRTRPELNFVPEPVPEPPVQSGSGTGTRLCHRYRY